MKKFTGDHRLKIYGKTHCSSGKHSQGQLSLNSESEAIEQGLYPCKHCLPDAHLKFALYLRLPLR